MPRWWCSRATSRSAPTRTSYYDELIKRFNEDTKHVQHVQDFWGDPLTAAGSQSPDGKAAYVQVFLAGNQGEALSLESVNALRDIIAKTPAPHGIHAYVAGSAAQIADQFEVGNEGTVMVTAVDRRGDRGDVADRLPLAGHHDHRARHGAHRDVGGARDRLVPGERRDSLACRRIRPTSSRCWSSPPGPTT